MKVPPNKMKLYLSQDERFMPQLVLGILCSCNVNHHLQFYLTDFTFD